MGGGGGGGGGGQVHAAEAIVEKVISCLPNF